MTTTLDWNVMLALSTMLVVIYAITTSELGRLLRTLFMRWPWWYTLLSCPYCTGWWAALATAYLFEGDIVWTPLYFMAVPITQHIFPRFITGPQPAEIAVFHAKHNPELRRSY